MFVRKALTGQACSCKAWGARVGSGKPKPVWEVFETGREPEFFCTHTKIEQAGGGNLRVYCYNLKHDTELHLIYTVVVPAPALAEMARRALGAASDAHNLSMWESDGEAH